MFHFKNKFLLNKCISTNIYHDKLCLSYIYKIFTYVSNFWNVLDFYNPSHVQVYKTVKHITNHFLSRHHHWLAFNTKPNIIGYPWTTLKWRWSNFAYIRIVWNFRKNYLQKRSVSALLFKAVIIKDYKGINLKRAI